MEDDNAGNIVDLVRVVAHFFTMKGEENYNEIADLDKNGAINMVDIVIVLSCYQKCTKPCLWLQPPQELVVENYANDSVTLSWTPPINMNGILGYEVLRDNVVIGTTENSTYTDTGIKANTAYTYAVRGYGGKDTFAKESYEVFVEIPDVNAPTKPIDLKVVETTDSTITFEWKESTDNVGVAGYNIYCGEELIGTTNADVTSFTAEGLKRFEAYYFTVEAFNQAGICSDKSEPLEAGIGLVLESDMTIEEDLCINAGTLDLNGHKLVVEGNILQNGGMIDINGGSLIVKGDYFVGDAEQGQPGKGKLVMTHQPDYVRVEGDFLMYSSSDHTGLLTEGTIELKGSFTQKNGGCASNFYATGYNKVLLSADRADAQTITFDNVGSSKINILEVKKPIEFYEFIDTASIKVSKTGMRNMSIGLMAQGEESGSYFYEELIEGFKKDYVARNTQGVNTADGSFSYGINSMLVKMIGFDLNIGANYNSLEEESKMLKNGWSFSLEGWLDIEEHGGNNKLIKVMIPGGEKSYFVYSGGSIKPKYTRNRLSMEGSSYVLATKDLKKYGYESYGTNKYRIKWMEDRYGNRIDFQYDGSNRIKGITDAVANSIDISYDAGKIEIKHMKSSRVVSYIYEGDLLKQVADPMGIKTSFEYDEGNRIAKIVDNNGNVVGRVTYKANSSGKPMVNVYVDSLGNYRRYTYYENENRTELEEGEEPPKFVQIAAADKNIAALKEDGTVVVWGSNINDECDVPEGLAGVKKIAAGQFHIVALKNDGTVVAWGRNVNGECEVPKGLTGVKEIAVGISHTVALKEDGTVVAWGKNNYGQCSVPEGLKGVKAIAAGEYHTVALKEDGTVVAWGRNYFGLCKVPEGLTGVKEIAAGVLHTVALKKDGTVVVWGPNLFGECNVPEGLRDVKTIFAKENYTAALKADGTVAVWGSNTYGVCDVPESLGKIEAIYAGRYHIAALKSDGTVEVWGWNTLRECEVPEGLTEVKELALGYAYTAALKKDGTVVVWGSGIRDNMPKSKTRTTTYIHKDHRVVEIIDPLGKSTTYTYNDYAELESYTDRYGNTTTYLLNNSTGNVEKIINPDKSEKTFGYDSNNNLIWEKDEEGIFTRYVYKNSYDYDTTNENIKYVSDSDGIHLRMKATYLKGKLQGDQVVNLTKDNAADFAITEYLPYTTEELKENNIKLKGIIHKVKDPLGNITTYYHYENGNVRKIEEPYDENSPSAKVTEYTYNNMDVVEYEYSPKRYRTDYVYNANGQVTEVVKNNGDNRYTPITKSSITKIYYDNMGRIKQTISPKENDELLPEVLGEAGYKYEYYSSGKLWKVTDPYNYTTIYTYDLYGNLKTEQKPNGSVYLYEYDDLDRLTSVYFKEDSNSKKELLEECFYWEETSKDEQNNYFVTTKERYEYLNDYSSRWTTYYYDYAGRIIKEEYRMLTVGGMDFYGDIPMDFDNTMDFDYTVPDIENGYYKNGMLKWTKDARGNKTYYSYWGYDSTSKTTYDEVWIPAKEENGTIKYTYKRIDYDKAGRKVTESTGKDFVELYGKPKESVTYKFSYYNSGKLYRESLANNLLKEYHYDIEWNLIEEISYIDPERTTIIKYENYDYLGKPERKVVLADANDIIVKPGDKTKTYSEHPRSIGLITSYEYDKNGNIVTETSPNGVTITYRYDMMNRLLETSQPGVDEYGQSKTIKVQSHYNWEGKVDYTIDAMGNKTEYVYNKRGLPEKVINIVTIDGEKTELITAYQYDRAGNLIAEVSPENYDPDKEPIETENRIEYTYDWKGRLKTKEFVGIEKQVDPDNGYAWIEVPVRIVLKAYEYDNNGNLIKELDALGYEAGTGYDTDSKIKSGYGTVYTYTLDNRVETVLDPETAAKGLPYSVKYEYDALGRKTAETKVKGTNKDDKYETTTTYEYDELGYIEAVLVDGEKKQSYDYDWHGNLAVQTDAENNTTTYAYNVMNQLVRASYPGDESIDSNVVVFKYDVMGNLVKRTNSMGTVDIYTYDNQGRVISRTTQKGEGDSVEDAITIQAKYDLNGNKRFETDGEGYTVEYIYDELNRLVETRYNGVKTSEGRIVNHSIVYRYDKDGNMTETVKIVQDKDNTVSNTYTNVYDPLGRLIETKDPDGIVVEKLEYNHNNAQIRSYDALNNCTEFRYDRNNRRTVTIDAENHIVEQGYDLAGNVSYKIDGRNNKTIYTYDKFDLLRKVEILENGKTVPVELSSYTYDGNGNILTQTDGKGNTITYQYNARNKLSKKTDGSGKAESYKYYADGNLKEKTDRNSIITLYTYDCHGRLRVQNSIGENPVKISYTYDNNGNVLTVTAGNEEIVRTYDELGRVKTKTVSNIGESKYEYDIIYDEEKGYLAEKSTDPKGNMTTKVYDNAGRLKYVVDGDEKSTVYTEYNYYANGNRESVVYPNGSKEVYTYYKNNLLRTLTNKKANGSEMDVYTYYYDGANNQERKHEKINGVDKGTTTYTYDCLNRLETVTEPSGRITVYTYDGAGNRETETIKDGADTIEKKYDYNDSNWLLSVTTKVNGTITDVVGYSYDDNGNQTQVYQNGELIAEYVYDSLNQLIKATVGENVINNTYNGEGLRVAKKVNGSITRYLYEYDKVVLEVSDSGGQIGRNIYGTNLLMRQADGLNLYYMYNGHADVTALIDANNGRIRASYYYDAFGNIQEEKYYTSTGEETSIPINNSILYAGYQYDKETGLYYLNARMYDPKVARFLQEDTYTGDPNDPLSLNLYTYCVNNPLVYYDPTGHNYIEIFGIPFGNPFEGIKILANKEAREKAFEEIDAYVSDDISDTNQERIAMSTVKAIKMSIAVAEGGKAIVGGMVTPLATWLSFGGGEIYNWATGEDELVRETYRELMWQEIYNIGNQDSLFKPLGNWIGYAGAVIYANVTGQDEEFKKILHEESLNEISRSGVAAVDAFFKPIENTFNRNNARNFFKQTYYTPQEELNEYATNMFVTGMMLYGGYSKLKSTGLKIDASYQYSVSTNGTVTLSPKLSYSFVKDAATARATVVGNSTIAAASLVAAGGGGNSFNDKGTSKTLNSFDDVADYIKKNGKLPDNFITKDQAKALGWDPKKGNLADVAPGKSIGGDIFKNKGTPLPDAPGRVWYEADINYSGGFRGTDRIIYSNDGLIYKTSDHYKTFTQIK